MKPLHHEIISFICGTLFVFALVGGAAWMRRERMGKATSPEPVSRFDLFDGATATCEISFYSSPEHGRPTASGEIFDSTALTCASIDPVSFGRVICFRNGDRECVAVVTDRMPSIYRTTHPWRKYDVSKAVAESLGIVLAGIKTVEVKIIKYNP